MSAFSLSIILGSILSLFVGIYVYNKNSQISELSIKLSNIKAEYNALKLESDGYKSALDTQNKKIKLLEFSEKLAQSKLKKWQSKPPEIKYKTITKIREVKSDECEDIKNQLDAIRSIDFNEL